MIARYAVAVITRTGAQRRIGLRGNGKTLGIVWANVALCERTTFTDAEYPEAVKWAALKGFRLVKHLINPYPWLVLDTDTHWPNSDLCHVLNTMGQHLKRTLYIREGLRTFQRQTQLYEAGMARYGYPAVLKWVAKPGTSRHETGVAADVGVGAFNGTNLGDYPGARTLAAQLGASFPMSYEPWHIECR